MSGGSPVGNALANSQQQTPMGGGSSPLNTGGGMSGGQGQMPSFAMPYMQQALGGGRQPQQQFAPFGSGRGDPIDPSMKIDRRLARGQMLGYDPGPQQPELSDVVGHFGNMQYRPQQQQPLSFEQWRAQPRMQDQQYRTPAQQAQIDQQAYQQYLSGTDNMQVAQPQPMRNPFQPDPSMVAEEYPAQSYGDMQYRPQPYNPYQQQMQQMRQFQQPSPFRGGSFMQNFAPYQAGLQSLVGQARGRPVPQQRTPMAMFPQSFGREQRYANPSADYRSVNRVAQAAPAAPAAQAEGFDPFYNSNVSSGF